MPFILSDENSKTYDDQNGFPMPFVFEYDYQISDKILQESED